MKGWLRDAWIAARNAAILTAVCVAAVIVLIKIFHISPN